ncbi:MAG: ABC-F family ATP-binding cassette domain-containing protein [Candidatus Firestonebacteria bacterium]
MLQITNLSKHFGERVLLEDASVFFNSGERVALIGPNGSGKTTIFKIIMGEEHPDSGEIVREGISRVSFLPQEIDSIRGKTVLEEVMSDSKDIKALKKELVDIEHRMAEGGHNDQLFAEYSRLHLEVERSEGVSSEYRAKRILAGLGFTEKDYGRKTEEFSGGWLMRIALAKLLVNPSDIMLLDEPTNHLDLNSLLWLQDYITSYDGILIFTSHDRDFMDHVATRLVDIDSGKLVTYKGNYQYMVDQKELKKAQLLDAKKRQDKEKEQLQDFINRFKSKASKAASARSKMKYIEKMEEIVVVKEQKTLRFSFPQPEKSGREVISLHNLHKSYGENKVYQGVDFKVDRGDKVALVGVNGAGKSTLLKILAGILPFEKGQRKEGFNVKPEYYPQYRLDVLDPEKTCFQEVDSVCPMRSELEIRKHLGIFMFKGDDVFKQVKVLSGGEKSRLVLVKVLSNPPNFILMDEPTNHLDIPSRDILIKALKDYTGSICFISHDVHFIKSIANKIVEVDNGKLTAYPGDFDYYIYKKKLLQKEAEGLKNGIVKMPKKESSSLNETRPQEAKRKVKHDKYKRAKLLGRVEKAEKETAFLEARYAEIGALLSNPATYKSRDSVEQVKEHKNLKERIDQAHLEWEKHTKELEEYDKNTGVKNSKLEKEKH